VIVNPDTPKATPVTGDLFVFAQGQDNAPFALLKDFASSLIPEGDPARAFGMDSPAATGLQSPDASLRVVGASAHRLGMLMTGPDPGTVQTLAQRVQTALGEVKQALSSAAEPKLDLTLLAEVCARLQAEAEEVAGEPRTDPLKRPGAKDPVPKSKEAREAFTKVADAYDKHRAGLPKELPPTLLAALGRFDIALADARRQAPTERMKGVLDSLPPNVVANDQITPTRSAAIGAHAFLPRDAGRHVNFANGDRNALAAYLIVNYPKLAEQKLDDDRTRDAPSQPNFGKGEPRWTVDRVVSAIIASRRKPDKPEELGQLAAVVQKAPPAVPPHDAYFPIYWNHWLERFK
jgi:hypothetical protein